MKNIIEKIKNNIDILGASYLWIFIWATYNTDIFRALLPGFPHNFLDFIHGIRAFLPFLALIISIYILFKNKGFNLKMISGPLGLLGLYALVGIFASLFSRNILFSLYWGVLYITAIVVLFSIFSEGDFKKRSSLIMKINWIIGGLVALGLTLFFFMQPGIFSISTYKDFLIGLRPYESLGNVKAETNIIGMVGSRSTGLGRYAGLLAIVMFANIWRKNKKTKLIFIFLFTLFFVILLFSRARTSIVAFLVSILIILWMKSKSKISLIFIISSILMIFCVTGSYKLADYYLIPGNTQDYIYSQENNREYIALTLSGRTEKIWPKILGVFYTSPIIGRGFQADRIFLNGLHSHNTFLQVLIQSGILGAIFFVLAFLLLWIGLLSLFKIDSENLIILESIGVVAFFAVRSITESSSYFGADFLFLLPLLAYVQFYPKQNKDSLKMDFLGNKIDLINKSEVVKKINNWIKNESQKPHWIVATGMHGIVEAEKHKDFKYIISGADLFVPDGISLVWLGRLNGFNIKERTTGSDLMNEMLSVSEKNGYKHFFYGDTKEVLSGLNKRILKKFPKLKIAGSYSPPFRELTDKENEEVIERINSSGTDILWVGLGLPKQEKWIFKNKEKLKIPVVVGVGAAFKFLSGSTKKAPKIIGDLGFEWLWRFFTEPKRIWKRVFIDMPIFFWLVFIELVSPKSYKE
jgi:N-acetylglucosaminyldiphosphoundecaprenol N-acetyl-beta-D-mannosaminyltransferase